MQFWVFFTFSHYIIIRNTFYLFFSSCFWVYINCKNWLVWFFFCEKQSLFVFLVLTDGRKLNSGMVKRHRSVWRSTDLSVRVSELCLASVWGMTAVTVQHSSRRPACLSCFKLFVLEVRVMCLRVSITFRTIYYQRVGWILLSRLSAELFRNLQCGCV